MKGIVLVYCIFLFQESIGFCPSGCQCDDQCNTVNCFEAGLNVVPILLNPCLKTLNLSFNKIRSITQAFDFYEKVQHLDLSHNLITSLGRGNFIEQLKTRVLNLSNNNLSIIYGVSFKGLRSLTELDLSHNKLVNIPSFFLSDSSELRVINLSNNRIRSIFPKTFNGLKRLNIINISDNKFSRIPGASLLFVKNSLESLDVSGNRLYAVQPDDLPTPHLKVLYIKRNKISFIDPESFIFLNKLKYLHLDSNSLKYIPSRSFQFLKSLSYLNISKNNFTSIDSYSFRSLNYLSKLEVSACLNLEKVFPDSFRNCNKLKTLIMTDNPKLTALPKDFLSSSNIENLHLSNNSLETVVKADFPWKTLDSLDLRGNPLVCNCSLRWLREIVLSANTSTSFPGLSCEKPKELRGIPLSLLTDSELYCYNLLHQWLIILSVATLISAVIIITIIFYSKSCTCLQFASTNPKLSTPKTKLCKIIRHCSRRDPNITTTTKNIYQNRIFEEIEQMEEKEFNYYGTVMYFPKNY